MAIIDKISYLRAIFIILPTGLGSLFVGIQGLSTSEESLPKYTGTVKDIYIGQAYSDLSDDYTKTLIITFKNDKEFKTTITDYISLIKKNIDKGDIVAIWTYRNNNGIRQLMVQNELLIPYSSHPWINILFLVIGIAFTVIAVGYLITTPEDLLGGNKNKKSSS